MITFDNYNNENKTGHNSKLPYRIIIAGDSGSGKTIALLF